ncbi:cyclodeaminase/cyclohydrolase family protein [Adlercreutzia sp. ZJ154]|uniref:cyclodeaminase/cyclohydrolase family protein n=1 Tax=Adlercreutzia sp. ZJ154 TaxID=2709790 RepID=UPI0013EDF662|nr:cyclodeaminase/cyclohydrolase family protein [Adlercreutzia sp. ZJ154]
MLTEEFIEDLASSAPTPGGGGACACVGALSAALASMVGNITVSNQKYANTHEQMRASVNRLKSTRKNLLRLIDLDAEAFASMSAAFKMPADTSEQIASKELALNSALIQACDIPLDIMQECADVLDECKMLVRDGSRMVVSDAGVAAVFAKAAIKGAALNVCINTEWMTEESLAKQYMNKVHRIMSENDSLADEIYAHVLERVGGGE